MSTSVGGAIRQVLQAALTSSYPNINIMRDMPDNQAPQGDIDSTPFPYIVITEGISEVSDPSSGRDNGAGGNVIRLKEMVQIDLYQQRGEAAEDVSIVPTIIRSLEKAQVLSISPNGVLVRMHYSSKIRRYEKGPKIINDTMTFEVRKSI